MKKILNLILSIILVIAFAATLLGFATIAVKSIKLNSSSVSLEAGKTYALKASYTPANTTQKLLTFSTGNKSVATVDKNGIIKGLKAGNTVITVASTINKTVIAKCTVKVLEKEVIAEPLGKYPKTITVRAARVLEANVKFVDGENIENNIWAKAYEDRLGIKVKYQFTAPAAQYNQKVAIFIASNDIPDIFPVSPKDFVNLVDAGMIQDISTVYKKYALPILGEWEKADPFPRKVVTVNGKLMAIPPFGTSLAESSNVLYVRNDWLKNLNLQVPKTLNDLFKVVEAFATKDPDMNGKKDTFGLALSKDFFNAGLADPKGFFNGYHAYPRAWVEDASGKLVYGSTQPVVKTVLAKLQEMYKSGLIDKEFLVKDRWKVGEDIAAGKIGLNYGAAWNAGTPISSSFINDPKADWLALPIVSIDNKPALGQTSQSAFNKSVFVVRKGYKYPEAIVKIINLAADIAYINYQHPYTVNPDGTPTYTYQFASVAPPNKNPNYNVTITNTLKDLKDVSDITDPRVKVDIENILKFTKDGDRKYASNAFTWVGPNSSFGVVNYYSKNNYLMIDKFASLPTQTMVEKKATLDTRELEVFTKIIIGDSLDNFDKFVDEWYKLGGEQITKEVNAWYEKNK